jgi:hypothetical protein
VHEPETTTDHRPEPPRDPYPHTREALDLYDRRTAAAPEARERDTRPSADKRAEHREALARFEVREAFCRDTRARPDRLTRKQIAMMSVDEIRASVTREQES